MDVFCLLPLDFFYFKVGVNSLLRLPRCFKVSQEVTKTRGEGTAFLVNVAASCTVFDALLLSAEVD